MSTGATPEASSAGAAPIPGGGTAPDPDITTPEPTQPEPTTPDPGTRRRSRPARLATTAGRCVLAGLAITLSLPPFGWWPLAFAGVFGWDRLLADQHWAARFRRTWLVAAAWLFPSMLWMFDLTAPGYLVANISYSGYFAVFAALVPRRAPGRWLAFPGAVILGEMLRWSWPFGGVPLATLAQSQAAAPLAQTARLGNAILVSGLVAVGGVALSAAWERRWRAASVAGGAVLGLYVLSLVAPRGHDIQPMHIAIVQGGGVQRTRFGNADAPEVFQRHLEASQRITGPVDLVVWPENTVSVEGGIQGTYEDRKLADLARRLHAPIAVGVTEGRQHSFENSVIVYDPNGTIVDRFEKVHRVPFGEYVPLRGLIEKVAGTDAGLPARDAEESSDIATVKTPAGPVGVVVSWEVFFTDRAAEGISNGGEVLLNPTNGASYWLDQVQTQQVASSRLRAIETGRYTAQAAPTGFSVVIDPNGKIIDCTRITPAGTSQGLCISELSGEDAVSAQMVLDATVERRGGSTVALTIGQWPIVLAGGAAMVAGWALDRRTRETRNLSPTRTTIGRDPVTGW